MNLGEERSYRSSNRFFDVFKVDFDHLVVACQSLLDFPLVVCVGSFTNNDATVVILVFSKQNVCSHVKSLLLGYEDEFPVFVVKVGVSEFCNDGIPHIFIPDQLSTQNDVFIQN